jgi:hypothetical protein
VPVFERPEVKSLRRVIIVEAFTVWEVIWPVSSIDWEELGTVLEVELHSETFLFVLLEGAHVEVFGLTVYLYTIKFSLIVGIDSIENQFILDNIISHKFNCKLSLDRFNEFLEHQVMSRLHDLRQTPISLLLCWFENDFGQIRNYTGIQLFFN